MRRCLSVILALMFLCAGSALADGKFVMITAGWHVERKRTGYIGFRNRNGLHGRSP